MSSRGTGTPRRVFVDTSAYYGLTDSGEGTHTAASAIRDRLIAGSWHLFTTNFVLAETHALLLIRLGRIVARRVLDQFDHSRTTTVRVSTSDEQQARAILTQYRDKDFSLTDATSFVVMERLSITYAFTFDRHFAQYGFNTPVLLPTTSPDAGWPIT